jgi:hypothetical protein
VAHPFVARDEIGGERRKGFCAGDGIHEAGTTTGLKVLSGEGEREAGGRLAIIGNTGGAEASFEP